MGEQKRMVYSIPCTECPKGRANVYIGQTGRCLKHWLKEDQCALSNDVAASALAEHALTAGHGVDLNKAEVLNSHPYTTARCVLERCHIQRNADKLNREQ